MSTTYKKLTNISIYKDETEKLISFLNLTRELSF